MACIPLILKPNVGTARTLQKVTVLPHNHKTFHHFSSAYF